MIIQCTTTDGDALIDIEEITIVLSDPQDTSTSMVYLKNGKSYEVAGTLADFKRLFMVESSYIKGGVLPLVRKTNG